MIELLEGAGLGSDGSTSSVEMEGMEGVTLGGASRTFLETGGREPESQGPAVGTLFCEAEHEDIC